MDRLRKKGYGFEFSPQACDSCPGHCCRGESGNIWVNQKELVEMSSFLKINQIDFIQDYLIKKDGRYTLREVFEEDEHICVFFDKKCTVYEVRPKQCRDYPFWDYYKDKKERLKDQCPGVNIEQTTK